MNNCIVATQLYFANYFFYFIIAF